MPVPVLTESVHREPGCPRLRRAGRARRGGVPPLPAPRPQAGPLLDRRRHSRRQRPLALRPPRASRHARKVDRRKLRRARRPARSRPHRLRRGLAPRRPRRGARLPLHAAHAAQAGPDSYDRTESARRLWQRCRAIDGTHAEAYLRARAIHRCRFPALRFHPRLLHRDEAGVRRLPALVAAVTGTAGPLPASTGPGSIRRARPRRPWRGRARRSAASTALPSASATPPPARCWSARASRRFSPSSPRCPAPSRLLRSRRMNIRKDEKGRSS